MPNLLASNERPLDYLRICLSAVNMSLVLYYRLLLTESDEGTADHSRIDIPGFVKHYMPLDNQS